MLFPRFLAKTSWTFEYTKMPLRTRKSGPTFEIGDRVRITFPGLHRGKEGSVMEVVNHKGDYVYRYRIRFHDGETATLFEFELQKDAA